MGKLFVIGELNQSEGSVPPKIEKKNDLQLDELHRRPEKGGGGARGRKISGNWICRMAEMGPGLQKAPFSQHLFGRRSCRRDRGNGRTPGRSCRGEGAKTVRLRAPHLSVS